MQNNNYILFKLAYNKRYNNALCLFLHAKEVECVHYVFKDTYSVPHPYVDVLQEGIKDGVIEKDLLKMSLGEMDYILRVDTPWDGKSCEELDREMAIEDGEEAYSALLRPSGEFNYKQAFEELVKKYPDFAERMKESGHPL